MINLTLDEIKILLNTKTAKEIFKGNKDEIFRYLAYRTHPDNKKDDGSLFRLLNKKFEELTAKKTTITSKKRSYTIEGIFAEGDICTIFQTDNMLLKIGRSPKTKLDNERNLLKALSDNTEELAKLRYYYDVLLDSFTLPDGRSCDVFAENPHKITLENIKNKYQKGLPWNHCAWIFKRILAAIHYCHSCNHVHSAILPSHILVNPQDHGCMVIGLNHSYKIGEKCKTISPKYEALYAPEILKKESQDASTDIYMATQTLRWLLGDQILEEKRLKIFLDGLTLTRVSARMSSALEVHWALDEILRKVFGPPKFHKLEV